MKEDAQLICPISYEDPDGHWGQLEPAILDRLPLREVTWKSPISSTYITISKLPLRFLPTDANLFKDTDHPFRWFLSQYVSLYVVVAETLETYKIVKPNVKKWVDANNNTRGSFGKRYWIVIYLTLGNYPSTHYAKISAKIASDFYFERSGDRTVMLSLQSDPGSLQIGQNLTTSNFQMFSSANDGFGELMSKIREGIISSFQVRSSLYYAEIRKLDATRGTPNFDFKQLFLVKESFALLYQMMQLLEMALAQYEELEAMLAYAPPGILFDGWWPLKAPEQLKTGDALSPETPKEREKDIMADPVKNGDDIVTYSINIARMKVLKGKMSLLELYRYIFARQMFFLVTMHRPVDCAEKIRRFMAYSYQTIDAKIEEIGDRNEYSTAHIQAKVWAFTASIKCVRLCRDLIDNMIAAENVSGLESTQSVAAILNVIRAYRVTGGGTTGGSDSDHRESSLMPTDGRSNRDTHLAKDKMLTFRESFVLLGNILQSAIQKFNDIVPMKLFLRRQIVHSMHQSKLFANESLPLLAETDASAAYFNLFDRSVDVKGTLDRDLDSSSFSVSGGLEQVLSSISQRIRSVSHYWAKLYHMKSFEVLYEQEDDTLTSDKAKQYMFLVQSCRFQQPQIEKGRILEASLHSLLTLVASEFNILCDRRSAALVERFNLAQHLMCTGQYLKSSQVLNGLMMDPNGEHLYHNPWASSWPDLMQSMLLMMSRCAIELGDYSDFRKAVATLVTLNIQQKDFFRTDLFCSFDKMVALLVHPPDGVNYDHELTIPAKGIFHFDISRAIYPEESSPQEALSPTKSVNAGDKKGPVPSKVAAASAVHSLVPSEHIVRRKGMQLVHENPFPVQWLACVCDQGHIPIQLQIQSLLGTAIPAEEITIHFRRVPPQGFDNMFGSVDTGHAGGGHLDELGTPVLSIANPALSPPPPPPTSLVRSEFSSNAITVEAEDELTCSVTPSNTTLEGLQTFELQLIPSHLGDYVIDRFDIRSGSLTWSHRILDDYETPAGVSMDYQQGPIVSDENVQRYFDKFPIFRISPPKHILSFNVHTGSKLPPNQTDYVYVTFDVPAGDFVREINFDVKAISRCRRWNGIEPKHTSFEALSSVQYRAEWISSPARSFYRTAGGGDERSGSIDETNLGQYMARDYTVTVENPKDWACWELPLSSASTAAVDASDSNLRREKELVVVNETMTLQDIEGGKRIVVQVPVTIRTSLLTNIAEEFTLQSPLQVHIQGLIRKGVCFVPFHTIGSATLLCSNVLKSAVLQQVGVSPHHSLLQLQLNNIHHQPLRLLGNAFVCSSGAIVDLQEEVNTNEILYPTDLKLVSSTEESTHVCKTNSSVAMRGGVHLCPAEEFHTFVQTISWKLLEDQKQYISAWRLFYRREETGSSCSFPETNHAVFWIDVPLCYNPASPSVTNDVTSPAVMVKSASHLLKEGRILPVIATQSPWECALGDVVVFRVRVGLRGTTFRYLVDSIEMDTSSSAVQPSGHNGTATSFSTYDLTDFRSSFIFQVPSSNDNASPASSVRCEILECPAWVPLGMKVVKQSVSSSIEYDVLVAAIPAVTGVQNVPPVMIHEADNNSILLIPHNASKYTHALVLPIRQHYYLDNEILPTTHIIMASYEEIRV